MKAIVLAAALAALSTIAPAGAARDVHTPKAADATTATVMADAGRIGSASLTALNGGNRWMPAERQAGAEFDVSAPEVDTGSLVIVLGVFALIVARPVSRTLRRLEQQRRATALASTLDHAPHG